MNLIKSENTLFIFNILESFENYRPLILIYLFMKYNYKLLRYYSYFKIYFILY